MQKDMVDKLKVKPNVIYTYDRIINLNTIKITPVFVCRKPIYIQQQLLLLF